VKSDAARSRWPKALMPPAASRHSPLRQLLYVEWILLGMAIFMTLPAFALCTDQCIAWSELGTIALFAGMGLRLPQRRLQKLIYTALELVSLLLMSLTSSHLPVLLRLLPLLGLVVVIRSCQLFSGRGRVLVVVAVYGLHWFTAFAHDDATLGQDVLRHISNPPTLWQVSVFKVNALVLFALVLLLMLLLVNALLSVYRSQQELSAAHEQLRRYALKVEDQATLQERNRIAREIHDSLGHSLTAQTILLENALLFLPADLDRSRQYVVNAKESAYQALREVSKSVSTLRRRPMLDRPLPQALLLLVHDICRPAQIEPECLIELPPTLSDEIDLALFRIVQEALTNTVKHSQASWVQVRLMTKRDRLHLQVRDDGRGFDPAKNTSGFGLRGIRERALALEGTCQIWSAPAAGCRISVILPLPSSLEPSA
jgi:signal transduction histidine kinase